MPTVLCMEGYNEADPPIQILAGRPLMGKAQTRRAATVLWGSRLTRWIAAALRWPPAKEYSRDLDPPSIKSYCRSTRGESQDMRSRKARHS